MCKIISFIKYNDKIITRETLYNAWKENNDGTGIYYYDKRLKRSFVLKCCGDNNKDFDAIYRRIIYLTNDMNKTNFLIHFRLATSGLKSEAQVHPIKICGNIYLAHNGIEAAFDYKDDRSDTQNMAWWFNSYYFARNNIKQIDKLSVEQLKYLSKMFSLSKLILLQNDKRIVINEELGQYKDDKNIWQSWDERYIYKYYYNNKLYEIETPRRTKRQLQPWDPDNLGGDY